MASSRFLCFYGLLAGLIASPASSSEPVDSKGPIDWVKHEIVQRGHCNTAIALDANEDGLQDVVCSYGDRVVLHLAPTWTREVVLHRFASGRKPCIHSAVLDVDQDGDLDWAGAVAAEHPFWLENPGTDEALAGAWTARPIDSTITGIHCLLAADIDRDGKDDLLVNNFLPEKGLKDSIAWLKVPAKPHLA
ncbi:MAG: VCBS repeat-containing protein, partial [Pseudomonadota bacterium]